MLPTRIIPRLDIKSRSVVKGVKLEGLRTVGVPRELAAQYYREQADEILFMDIVASLYSRNNILEIVTEVAQDIFVPLTVGGGIRSLEDIVSALRAGADKVAINTAAISRPKFLEEAANAFGSQCIVLSIEAKWREDYWECYTDNGRERTHKSVLEWAREAEQLGVGEILITSVDRDGTKKGFEIELVQEVCDKVTIPVIASGGAGEASHVSDLIAKTKVDGVCCATMFHFGVLTLPELKALLCKQGFVVRV